MPLRKGFGIFQEKKKGIITEYSQSMECRYVLMMNIHGNKGCRKPKSSGKEL